MPNPPSQSSNLRGTELHLHLPASRVASHRQLQVGRAVRAAGVAEADGLHQLLNLMSALEAGGRPGSPGVHPKVWRKKTDWRWWFPSVFVDGFSILLMISSLNIIKYQLNTLLMYHINLYIAWFLVSYFWSRNGSWKMEVVHVLTYPCPVTVSSFTGGSNL